MGILWEFVGDLPVEIYWWYVPIMVNLLVIMKFTYVDDWWENIENRCW